MPSHGKSKAKTESKTAKLDRINAECENLEQKIAENDALISSLEQQYQVDADGRLAYKKSTHEKLSVFLASKPFASIYAALASVVYWL